MYERMRELEEDNLQLKRENKVDFTEEQTVDGDYVRFIFQI